MSAIEILVLQISRQAIFLVILISGIPIMLSMVIGVMISIFQAATQIQEQTLTMVPKMVIVFGTLIIAGYWMMSQLVKFAHGLFSLIPQITIGIR